MHEWQTHRHSQDGQLSSLLALSHFWRHCERQDRESWLDCHKANRKYLDLIPQQRETSEGCYQRERCGQGQCQTVMCRWVWPEEGWSQRWHWTRDEVKDGRWRKTGEGEGKARMLGPASSLTERKECVCVPETPCVWKSWSEKEVLFWKETEGGRKCEGPRRFGGHSHSLGTVI